MMREYQMREINPEEVSNIWKRIYEENPRIKNALLAARAQDISEQQHLNEVLSIFYKSHLVEELTESEIATKDRLYKYWKEAGLEGTPEEMFNDFINKHFNEFMIKYDLSKSPLEQSSHKDKKIRRRQNTVARNNMLIDLIQKRLEDAETFDKRYTPGGFPNKSRDARVMRELEFTSIDDIMTNGQVDWDKVYARAENKDLDPEPNYDPSDPMTIIVYNQQNQVAGKLIGIFANQNTNHAFATLMEEFKLKEDISFCGHHYGNTESTLLRAPSDVDVDTNVAECLAASVDATKDPVLNFLNFNTITADSAGLLARIGYTGEEIGLLLNQPIIKRVCEKVFNEDEISSISIQNVKEELETILSNRGVKDAKTMVDLSRTFLATSIVKHRDNYRTPEEWTTQEILEQLEVLALFEKISSTAREVGQFITATKFTASNAVGSTFGDMYAQQLKVADYIRNIGKDSKVEMVVVGQRLSNDGVSTIMNSPLNDEDNSSISDDEYMRLSCSEGLGNPFAYEQAMYDMNKRAASLMMKYFPYDRQVYKTARNIMASITRSGTLDAETINKLHSDMLVFLLAQEAGSNFDGNSIGKFPSNYDDADTTGLNQQEVNAKQSNWKEMSRSTYYREVFPSIMAEMLNKNPELKAVYPLFQYMLSDDEVITQLDGTDKTVQTIMVQGVGGLDSTQKDAIRDSWIQLNRDMPDVARDLFLYNYYKLGFQFSPFTFMHLAPTELKKSITINGNSYLNFIRDLVGGYAYNESECHILVNNFIKQFILNHSNIKKLVYKPKSKSVLKVLQSKGFESGKIPPSSFTIKMSDLTTKNNNKSPLLLSADYDNQIFSFVPAIEINDCIYIAQGNTDQFNVIKGDTEITYKFYSRLGTEGRSMQYFADLDEAITKVTQSNIAAEQSNNGRNNSQLEGSTGGDPNASIGNYKREEHIKALTKYANELIYNIKLNIQAGAMSAEEGRAVIEQAELLRDSLNSVTDEMIAATVQSIQAEGTQLLDDEGNAIC